MPLYYYPSRAVTPTSGDNSTRIATTAYVNSKLSDLIGPTTADRDTLAEISDVVDQNAEQASTDAIAMSIALG